MQWKIEYTGKKKTAKLEKRKRTIAGETLTPCTVLWETPQAIGKKKKRVTAKRALEKGFLVVNSLGDSHQNREKKVDGRHGLVQGKKNLREECISRSSLYFAN